MKRWFLALAALLVALPLPGTAEEGARPYIFTQVHADSRQAVPDGALIQVQLPAGPARWRVADTTINAVLVGEYAVASPGRIPGTDSIQVFDFRVGSGAAAEIMIVSDNPPPVLAEIVPGGLYLLMLDSAAQ
jgi:hypothetical protein